MLVKQQTPKNQKLKTRGNARYVADHCLQVLQAEILFRSNHWLIPGKCYKILQLKKVLNDIKQSTAIQIKVDYSFEGFQIQDIRHIQFVKLKTMNLCNNSISNIQSLTLINMPCIEEILLDFNNINSIKSLANIKNQRLNFLGLGSNPIIDVKPLNRSMFDKKDFCLVVQKKLDINHYVSNQDLSFLAKLDIKVLQFFSKNTLNIKQNKQRVESQIRGKFNPCNNYFKVCQLKDNEKKIVFFILSNMFTFLEKSMLSYISVLIYILIKQKERKYPKKMQNSSQIIKFKSPLSQQKKLYIQKLINKLTIEVLSQYLSNPSQNRDLIIKVNSFPQDDSNIYQYIQQWKVVDFYSSVSKNGKNLIFKSIAQIKFHNLQQIQLFEKTLNNIQSIAFLDCPNLKRLCIQSQTPFSVKPLQKTNFKNLLVLQTYQHSDPQNADIENLRRFHMPKGMTKLEIFHNYIYFKSLRGRLFANTYQTKQNLFVSFVNWLCYK